jgi:hypothetical protein
MCATAEPGRFHYGPACPAKFPRKKSAGFFPKYSEKIPAYLEKNPVSFFLVWRKVFKTYGVIGTDCLAGLNYMQNVLIVVCDFHTIELHI